MSLEHLLRDEEELLRLFLREEFGMQETIVILTRVIFRCNYKPCGHSRQFTCDCSNRACGHIWAYDYETSEQGNLYRMVDGRRVFYSDDIHARCPKCSKRVVTSSKVAGKVGKKHCSDECEMATGTTCNCRCGGANHGKAYL